MEFIVVLDGVQALVARLFEKVEGFRLIVDRVFDCSEGTLIGHCCFSFVVFLFCFGLLFLIPPKPIDLRRVTHLLATSRTVLFVHPAAVLILMTLVDITSTGRALCDHPINRPFHAVLQ